MSTQMKTRYIIGTDGYRVAIPTNHGSKILETYQDEIYDISTFTQKTLEPLQRFWRTSQVSLETVGSLLDIASFLLIESLIIPCLDCLLLHQHRCARPDRTAYKTLQRYTVKSAAKKHLGDHLYYAMLYRVYQHGAGFSEPEVYIDQATTARLAVKHECIELLKWLLPQIPRLVRRHRSSWFSQAALAGNIETCKYLNTWRVVK